MPASDHFNEYRANPKYPARAPDLSRLENADEVEDLSSRPEVMSLPTAEENTGIEHCGIKDDDSNGFWLTTGATHGKYLWLIRVDDVKITIEVGKLTRTNTGGALKHSNLTGGDAYCGGELWFQDDRSIYANGGSSRFKPRGGDELEAVIACLRSAGYRVCSFGWNDATNREKRTLRRSEITWS